MLPNVALQLMGVGHRSQAALILGATVAGAEAETRRPAGPRCMCAIMGLQAMLSRGLHGPAALLRYGIELRACNEHE